MGFFKKQKIDTDKSLDNKKHMRNLFNKVVENGDDYQLVCGYSVDVKQSHYIVAKKTTYLYANYIIGYKENKSTVVMVETDPTLEGCGDPVYYVLDEIHKAYKMKFGGSSLIIYPNKKKYIQFDVFGLYTDEKLYPYLSQEQEAKQFNEFFLQKFKK